MGHLTEMSQRNKKTVLDMFRVLKVLLRSILSQFLMLF